MIFLTADLYWQSKPLLLPPWLHIRPCPAIHPITPDNPHLARPPPNSNSNSNSSYHTMHKATAPVALLLLLPAFAAAALRGLQQPANMGPAAAAPAAATPAAGNDNMPPNGMPTMGPPPVQERLCNAVRRV